MLGVFRGHRRATAVVGLVGAVAAGLVAGCSGDNKVPSIGYAFDNVVTTYNANTTAGAASGATVAFPRVLTGPFYTGPDGQPVGDTDWGTAKEVPGETQSIEYRIDPDAVYSDGAGIACDDLVLEWAARSGKFPQFDTANTAGYADIDRVECQPGAREATVVFRPGRKYLAWRTLFSAGQLMPAHVLAKAVNVPDVVSAINSGAPDVVGKIADFWNTGWNLVPGKLDLTKFPSSGPYRIDSYTDDGGLVLVANERWWGNHPATGRIVLWPKNIDLKAKLSQHAVEVVDIGAGSIDGIDLAGFTNNNYPSRNTEQLILPVTGVFDKPETRRALASCMPRQALYDQLGHPGYMPKQGGLGSGVLNTRLVNQDSLIYSAVAVGGSKYPGADAPAASADLDKAGNPNPTIRIGYLGPDIRRSREVAMIGDACKAAGITVVDAGSPQFDPTQLRDGKVDAMLAGTAGAAGSGGTIDAADAQYAWRTNSGANVGHYSFGRYDTLVDQIAVDDTPMGALNATVEAENLLWSDMASIPLYNEPRTVAFATGMQNTIANPNAAGSGWNMDRWTLKR